ncbi:hypothetical protein PR048_006960 [Dryococelus australis]|uniref:Uncharacterized protein n=1 Tax=Dryococelus australis TaxID=614101 RepID=A0ABQ9ICE3_9NEOP|nr:hypothetical protein PR048_006960 [Dryococelus australis]
MARISTAHLQWSEWARTEDSRRQEDSSRPQPVCVTAGWMARISTAHLQWSERARTPDSRRQEGSSRPQPVCVTAGWMARISTAHIQWSDCGCRGVPAQTLFDSTKLFSSVRRMVTVQLAYTLYDDRVGGGGVSTVVVRLEFSPPTKVNWVKLPAGSLRIPASGNRGGRCRWSKGFLGNLPFPPFSFRRFYVLSSLRPHRLSRPRYADCMAISHPARWDTHFGQSAWQITPSPSGVEKFGMNRGEYEARSECKDVEEMGYPLVNPSICGIVRHEHRAGGGGGISPSKPADLRHRPARAPGRGGGISPSKPADLRHRPARAPGRGGDGISPSKPADLRHRPARAPGRGGGRMGYPRANPPISSTSATWRISASGPAENRGEAIAVAPAPPRRPHVYSTVQRETCPRSCRRRCGLDSPCCSRSDEGLAHAIVTDTRRLKCVHGCGAGTVRTLLGESKPRTDETLNLSKPFRWGYAWLTRTPLTLKKHSRKLEQPMRRRPCFLCEPRRNVELNGEIFARGKSRLRRYFPELNYFTCFGEMATGVPSAEKHPNGAMFPPVRTIANSHVHRQLPRPPSTATSTVNCHVHRQLPRPPSTATSTVNYHVHRQLPRPPSTTTSTVNYHVHRKLPCPQTTATSTVNCHVHRQLPRPPSTATSTVNCHVHRQLPCPPSTAASTVNCRVHRQLPRPPSTTTPTVNCHVHRQLPRPPSTTASTVNCRVHRQLPRPPSTATSTVNYHVHRQLNVHRQLPRPPSTERPPSTAASTVNYHVHRQLTRPPSSDGHCRLRMNARCRTAVHTLRTQQKPVTRVGPRETVCTVVTHEKALLRIPHERVEVKDSCYMIAAAASQRIVLNDRPAIGQWPRWTLQSHVQICRRYQMCIGCLLSQWKAKIGHRSPGGVKHRYCSTLKLARGAVRLCLRVYVWGDPPRTSPPPGRPVRSPVASPAATTWLESQLLLLPLAGESGEFRGCASIYLELGPSAQRGIERNFWAMAYDPINIAAVQGSAVFRGSQLAECGNRATRSAARNLDGGWTTTGDYETTADEVLWCERTRGSDTRRVKATVLEGSRRTLEQCGLTIRTAGAAVAERLARLPLTKANRVQSPAGSLPDFCKWESCRTMPALLHSHILSHSLALKNSLLRAAETSSLNLDCNCCNGHLPITASYTYGTILAFSCKSDNRVACPGIESECKLIAATLDTLRREHITNYKKTQVLSDNFIHFPREMRTGGRKQNACLPCRRNTAGLFACEFKSSLVAPASPQTRQVPYQCLFDIHSVEKLSLIRYLFSVQSSTGTWKSTLLRVSADELDRTTLGQYTPELVEIVCNATRGCFASVTFPPSSDGPSVVLLRYPEERRRGPLTDRDTAIRSVVTHISGKTNVLARGVAGEGEPSGPGASTWVDGRPLVSGACDEGRRRATAQRPAIAGVRLTAEQRLRLTYPTAQQRSLLCDQKGPSYSNSVSEEPSNEVNASASLSRRRQKAPYEHVSEFERGRMIGHRETGMSYHDTSARTGRAATTVMRVWNHDEKGTGPHNVTTARDDCHLVYMAVTNHTASSTVLVRHWSPKKGVFLVQNHKYGVKDTLIQYGGWGRGSRLGAEGYRNCRDEPLPFIARPLRRGGGGSMGRGRHYHRYAIVQLLAQIASRGGFYVPSGERRGARQAAKNIRQGSAATTVNEAIVLMYSTHSHNCRMSQLDNAPGHWPKFSRISSRSILESSSDCYCHLVRPMCTPSIIHGTRRRDTLTLKILRLQIAGNCG